MFTPYDGTGDVETNTISLNLGINFYGNFRTEAGNFGVRAGGIHWYNLSPFTIGVYQPLERYSIFDRTPWEGVTGTAKYDSYFLTGQANPGDERFAYQAFQGLILNGQELPGGLGFDAFWGKTQPNGGLPNAATDPNGTVPGEGDVPDYSGFAGDSRVLPSFITGGRIQRAFGDDLFALNSIYSYRTLDSLTTDRREYQVHTGSFDANVASVNLSGELGASKFDSPDYTSKWGEALMVRAKAPEALTLLPLDVQVYQIGRHFFNENSEIATGNNPQIRTDPRCEVTAGAAGRRRHHAGQPAGAQPPRRQLQHRLGSGAGAARRRLGHGARARADDVRRSSTSTASTGWRSRGSTTRSPPRPSARPPSGLWRGSTPSSEAPSSASRTTDVEPVTGLPQNRKYYHAVDLQGKARARLLDRSLYFFYLGSFGSANPTAKAVPTDDDTYIFVQYHEFDLYYEVMPGFLLTAYLGLENARGGRFTELDATSGLPRDQHARGIGVGFDWTLARNAGLYLRHRWMDFEDRSFALDTYSGYETTLELEDVLLTASGMRFTPRLGLLLLPLALALPLARPRRPRPGRARARGRGPRPPLQRPRPQLHPAVGPRRHARRHGHDDGRDARRRQRSCSTSPSTRSPTA